MKKTINFNFNFPFQLKNLHLFIIIVILSLILKWYRQLFLPLYLYLCQLHLNSHLWFKHQRKIIFRQLLSFLNHFLLFELNFHLNKWLIILWVDIILKGFLVLKDSPYYSSFWLVHDQIVLSFLLKQFQCFQRLSFPTCHDYLG